MLSGFSIHSDLRYAAFFDCLYAVIDITKVNIQDSNVTIPGDGKSMPFYKYPANRMLFIGVPTGKEEYLESSAH